MTIMGTQNAGLSCAIPQNEAISSCMDGLAVRPSRDRRVGPECLSRQSAGLAHRLLNVIVGRLAGDDYVMNMRFAQAGVRDPNEVSVGMQLFNGAAAQVAHA